MNKQQLTALGATEIGRWPTFEGYSERETETLKDGLKSIVGFIYDTGDWPVPDEVYHPDNWKYWHLSDPNRPSHIDAIRNSSPRPHD